MKTESSYRFKDIEAIAEVLDTKFRGPWGIRYGLDGILGLIPGLGDLVTNAMAAYIILRATWHGYPAAVLARMVLNFIIDNLLDAVPVLGNVADFFFKSNVRNLELMRRFELDPERTKRRSVLWILLITSTMVLILLALIAAAFFLTYKFIAWLVALSGL
jgi:hypothetical protein